jgi:hypothetical protein
MTGSVVEVAIARQRIPARLLAAFLLASPATAQSRSDLDVTLHGTILLNGFRNSGATNNTDVPTFALPSAGTGDLGASVRQTRVRIEIRHPEILGASLFGELDADFFGGQQPSTGGRAHPVLRLRRAIAELRWSRAEVLAGQEAPPLFGVSPASLATVGFPGYAASGNLWLWLPQIRATGWLTGGDFKLGVEGTVMAPSAGDPQGTFLTQPDRAEATGKPAFEARAVGRWRIAGRQGEAGIGAHKGWLEREDGTTISSEAFGLSLWTPIVSWLEVRAEFFDGQAIAGLGGGGIGQSVNEDGQAINSRGGWAQLVVLPVTQVEIGFGAGQDDPDNADLTGETARTRNRSWAASIAWRAAPLALAFELRHLSTSYGPVNPRTLDVTHLNLAIGVEF